MTSEAARRAVAPRPWHLPHDVFEAGCCCAGLIRDDTDVARGIWAIDWDQKGAAIIDGH